MSHKSGADRLDRQLEEAKAARAKARDAEAEAADARADVTTLKAAYDEKVEQHARLRWEGRGNGLRNFEDCAGTAPTSSMILCRSVP